MSEGNVARAEARFETMPSARPGAALALALGLLAAVTATPAAADGPKTVALLTTSFQNDHEAYEPTKDAERARMGKVVQTFKSKLESSGEYKFVEVPPAMQARIDKDQKMGQCAGCEVAYGKELGVDQVAWITVQKVSDLILNLNVYIKDVKQDKMAFVQSVDMRGNTDESWDHSMKYLIKHYLIPREDKHG